MHDHHAPRPLSLDVLATSARRWPAAVSVGALALALALGACKSDDAKPAIAGITLTDPASAEPVAPQAPKPSHATSANARDAGGEAGAPDVLSPTAGPKSTQPKARPRRPRPPSTHDRPGVGSTHVPSRHATKPSLRTSAVAPGAKPAAKPASPPPTLPPTPPTPPTTPTPSDRVVPPQPSAPSPKPEPAPAPNHDRRARPAPAPAPAPERADASPPLDVTRFLPLAKVREITGERRMTPSGPLPGLPPTARYNSARFAPPGKGGFGAAVQVWRDGSRRDVNERYRRMRRQYPNAEETRAIEGTKAFYSYWGSVQTLTMMAPAKHTIISVACDDAVCSQKALLELAKAAKANL